MACATFKIGFFNDEQLRTFMKLLRAMQWCGSVGHSTAFNVGVDGDGRFSMDVEVIDKNGESKNLREIIECNSQIYEQACKEHRKWCPGSKCDLDFGFE